MGADPSYSFVSDTPLALKVASEQQALHKDAGSPQPEVLDAQAAMGRRNVAGDKTADDEAYRAALEHASHQRSSTAAFGVPPATARPGGVMLIDGRVIYPEGGVVHPEPLAEPTAEAASGDFSPLDFDSADFHQRPPAPPNPVTDVKVELNDPPATSDGMPADIDGRGGLSVDATVEPAKRQRSSRTKKVADGQAVTFVNDKGEPVTWITDSAPEHQRANARVIIERKLLERPDEIRQAARGLSQAFKAEADRLKSSKTNERGRLPQYEDLISFFEQMAAGLADLTDALDRAFATTTSPGPEPILIGKAAEIAHALQVRVQEWFEKTGTAVIDVPIKMGVLCSGIAFLHSIGADSWSAIGGLSWLIRSTRGAKDTSVPSDQAPRRTRPPGKKSRASKNPR
jgi:hypothetical protein